MSEENALIGQLLNSPSIATSDDLDLALLAHVLEGFVRWIRAKQTQDDPMGGQIWRGNFEPRTAGDPMGDWIARLGQA